METISKSREIMLTERYGHVLTLKDIADVLRYPSIQALRKAHKRGVLPFELVRFPHRNGLFVAARTVAAFLDSLDNSAASKSQCARP